MNRPLSLLIVTSGSILAMLATTAEANAAPAGKRAGAATWHVGADAKRAGDGSRRAPFGTLRRVERASAPGDRILVLRSRKPLDGGIALKPRQRLIGAGRSVRSLRAGPRSPRLTNTRPERHSGDAVVLANRVVVRNLEISGSHRGGIYGENVRGVRILGNDVSGQNTSCTPGFHIPPFIVPTNVPGVGLPISGGLGNGWGGIMVDADRGRGRIKIRNNRVHDAECGDGIDVRMSGASDYRAEITHNVVRDLRQGEGFESVLAIGLQTLDRSRLRARLDRNRQTNLGNPDGPELLSGELGSNPEGVYVNLGDASRMTVRIDRNTYTNPNELGGFSGNGLEYVAMGDGSRSRVVVRDSSFIGSSGDVLQQIALGTNHRMTLMLDGVIARDSLGWASSGIGNTFLIPGNNADCLLAASGGAGNVIRTTIRGSELSDCANNGVTFGSAVANGDGPTRSLALEIAGSRITGNRGANLRVGNLDLRELSELLIKVEDSNLSDSRGTGSGFANVSFEDLGATARTAIDLGGGELGSAGGNCIAGGALAAHVLRYDVIARDNWWGPLGPLPGRTVVAGGRLDADPTLTEPPQSC